MRDIHAAKVSSNIATIYDCAIGKDMGKSAFVAEFAVSLDSESVEGSSRLSRCLTLVKYLQGARSVKGSSECRNGQAFPAWQAPWR